MLRCPDIHLLHTLYMRCRYGTDLLRILYCDIGSIYYVYSFQVFKLADCTLKE